MNLVSGELQGQVTQLTKELELSKASKEQVQAAVSRLEAEKSVLVAEVQQVRSKAATDQEALGEKMRQQEAEAQKKFEEFKQDLMQLNNCKDFELGQEAFKSCQHSGDLDRQGPHGPHFPGPGDTDLVSPMVPSVLIAAEIDLGGTGHDTHGGAATLTIAPWQTSSDYKYTCEQMKMMLGHLGHALHFGDAAWPHTESQGKLAIHYLEDTAKSFVWGQEHDTRIVACFFDERGLSILIRALLTWELPRSIKLQVYQSTCMIIQNAKEEIFAELLKGSDLTDLLLGDPEIDNEEFLQYFLSLIKTLALRVKPEEMHLFVRRPLNLRRRCCRSC
eukprot:symbB.v1.2.036998.t1/scaffold5351.1/size28190/3